MQKIIIILVVSLLGTSILMAQNEIYGQIEYTHTTNFSRSFQRDYSLFFSARHSNYIEKNIEKRKEKIDQEFNEIGQQINRDVPRKNLTPQFFYNNRKDFYFREIWLDQELVVKEEPFQWKWNITEETRKIGRFNCQKATIRFRGRDYIAWFAKDIPVPFGPWKFQGLSGLILDVYDKDQVLRITASNVNITNQSEGDVPIDQSKFAQAMDIEQYLVKKKELLIEDLARLSARMPKGYQNLVLDEDCDDCKEQVEFFNK
ncbi:MAG: GLPGLI family protein [Bacteroidota bacterium]